MANTAADWDLDLLHPKVQAIGATLSAGLGKVASRLVVDMLTGMLISGSVRLTEIARALDESIPLHSTHKRLSRNLGNPGIGAVVADNLLNAGARTVRDDALLVIDVFDVVKKYAEKMEYLAASDASATFPTFPTTTDDVAHPPRAGRDARAGGAERGYRVCEIFAWDLDGGPIPDFAEVAERIPSETGGEEQLSAWNNLVLTPLAQTFYSPGAPDYRSETDEVVGLLGRVEAVLEGRGIFAIDIGDFPVRLRRHSYQLLARLRELPEILTSEVRCRYAARIPGDYPLLHGQDPTTAREIGDSCDTPYGVTVYKYQDNVDLGMFVHFGAVPVRLPSCPDRPLWLVAVKGIPSVDLSVSDLLILTTEPMPRNRKVIWPLVWRFLSYWDAVRTNQEVKDQFDFDDVRVLTYDRLRNLGALVLAAAYVESQWPGIAFRTSMHREPRSRSPRLFRHTASD